jgi:hypothetical protein
MKAVPRRIARALAIVLLAAGSAVAGQDSGGPAREGAADAAAEEVRGWCLACDAPAALGATTEIFKGRRVTVCNDACRAHFRAHADELFASLQARGVLFDENATAEREKPLMSGALWLGAYAVAGIVAAAITTSVALAKGLPALPWLLAGLFANVVGVALVLSRPRGDLSRLPQGVPEGLAKIASTHAPAACAKCGRANHPSAAACAGCGAALAPGVRSEVAAVRGEARS